MTAREEMEPTPTTPTPPNPTPTPTPIMPVASSSTAGPARMLPGLLLAGVGVYAAVTLRAAWNVFVVHGLTHVPSMVQAAMGIGAAATMVFVFMRRSSTWAMYALAILAVLVPLMSVAVSGFTVNTLETGLALGGSVVCIIAAYYFRQQALSALGSPSGPTP